MAANPMTAGSTGYAPAESRAAPPPASAPAPDPKARQLTVGTSAMEVSNDPEAMIITHALGSCIAVLVHDPILKVAGMLHYMLPLSSISPQRAKENPLMFADTGIPILFRKMYEFGSKKQNLVVKAAGGGKLYDDNGTFDIGRRNYTTMRKLFWQNGVLIAAEDVDGARSRTARLWVGSGRILIRSQGEEYEL